MLFAAIYVADFSVEALGRAEPELREHALAVVEGTPPLLTVVGANEQARQCGVEAGMTALQAEERLSCVKPAQLRRRSAAQEHAAHAALLDCACAFSPRVEDTAPDTILLDVAGLDRLFGPPAAMASELARRAAQAGMQVRVAAAANPDAAMHAARGFPGLTVIPRGKEAERLGGLPVDVLCGTAVPGCDSTGEGACATRSEMLQTLDRWGVRTLRALAALPEVAVAQRLGQQGVYWQHLARGESSRPLRVMEPPLSFEEAVELEYPVALLEPLAFVLNGMLEQLCFRLGTRALAAQELRLRLQLDDARDAEQRETGNMKRETLFERAIRLPVPMLNPKVFLKLLQLDLQAHPPSAPVIKILLEAEPAEPRRAQSGLFVPLAPEPEKLELTLARINSVVSRRPPVAGKSKQGRVGSPEVLDTHRPNAFRMRKFNPRLEAETQGASTDAPNHPMARETGASRSSRSPGAVAQHDNGSGQSPIANCPSPMAMRMFRPPQPVAVECRDGVPQMLRETRSAKRDTSRAVSGEVVWAAGPWRGSGDWWTEQPWSRDEWDVALTDKEGMALYRIYRDAAGAWFVEAEYD